MYQQTRDPAPPTPPQVTLVGKIVTVTEHAAHTSVTLDDGTGTATAKWWAEADDDGAVRRRGGVGGLGGRPGPPPAASGPPAAADQPTLPLTRHPFF